MNQVEYHAQMDELIDKLKNVVYPQETAPWITENAQEESDTTERAQAQEDDLTLEQYLSQEPQMVPPTPDEQVEQTIRQSMSPPVVNLGATEILTQKPDWSGIEGTNFGQQWDWQEEPIPDEQRASQTTADRLDDHVERLMSRGRYA